MVLWFMVYDSLPYIHMIISCVRSAEEKWIARRKKVLEEGKDKRVSGVEDESRVKEIDVSMAFHVYSFFYKILLLM